MTIAGEQCCSPDVVDLDQPCDPPLQSEGEPAMRRHAVPEYVQVGLIRLGRFTAIGESSLMVCVFMQPLATSHQLETAENQIERVRPVRVVRLRVGVEGPFLTGYPSTARQSDPNFSRAH
jgi:hypothetical protein